MSQTALPEGVVLDMLVSNTKKIIGDIKTGGSLSHSDHALMEF